MKFRATFSDSGKHLLEKQLLPCLEKHGKTCQILLSPRELSCLQTTEEADGMHITLRCQMEELFEANTWNVQSQHSNLIGLKIEIAHLKSALRAASNSHAEFVQIKLTSKSTDYEARQQPFLCLISNGPNSNMTHDLPLARHFPPPEVDEIVKQLEEPHVQLCPYYLEIFCEMQRLQAIVDKMKILDNCLSVATTKEGTMYLQVSLPGVRLATEVKGLDVYPPSARVISEDTTGSLSPEGRLQEALSKGTGNLVVTQVKHLAKSLHSAQAALPAKLLLGIAENAGHLHMMFVFPNLSEEGGHNDNINLSYCLPVRDEDCI